MLYLINSSFHQSDEFCHTVPLVWFKIILAGRFRLAILCVYNRKDMATLARRLCPDIADEYFNIYFEFLSTCSVFEESNRKQ